MNIEDNPKARKSAFVFTLNNYTDDKINKLIKLYEEGLFKYICWGKEVAPSTGTPHLQGYFELKTKRNMNGLQSKELKGIGMGLKIRMGNQEQAINYCKKDGEFVEYGTKCKQGKRTDLEAYRDMIIDDDVRVDDIAIENPGAYHIFGRTMEKLEELAMRKKFRTEMTQGIWLWGKTGVGKSHAAFKNFNPDTHYVLNVNDNGWWEGYKQQDVVIINEFRGQIPFGELLDLVDKWPKTVKRRNKAPLPFISKFVIITSSMPPVDIYEKIKNPDDSIQQLLRRFKVINIRKGKTIDLDKYLNLEAKGSGQEVLRGGNIDPPSLLTIVRNNSLRSNSLNSFDTTSYVPSSNESMDENDIREFNEKNRILNMLKPVNWETDEF